MHALRQAFVPNEFAAASWRKMLKPRHWSCGLLVLALVVGIFGPLFPLLAERGLTFALTLSTFLLQNALPLLGSALGVNLWWSRTRRTGMWEQLRLTPTPPREVFLGHLAMHRTVYLALYALLLLGLLATGLGKDVGGGHLAFAATVLNGLVCCWVDPLLAWMAFSGLRRRLLLQGTFALMWVCGHFWLAWPVWHSLVALPSRTSLLVAVISTLVLVGMHAFALARLDRALAEETASR